MLAISRWVPLVVLAAATGAGAAQQGQPVTTPGPGDYLQAADVEVAEATTALPPRESIPDRVDVDLSGSIAAALSALGDQHRVDWVLSLPGREVGEAKQFTAKDVPLWRALDQLLDTYGYDWGVSCLTSIPFSFNDNDFCLSFA